MLASFAVVTILLTQIRQLVPHKRCIFSLGRLTSSPGDVSLSNPSLRYATDNPNDAERYDLSR